MSDDLRGDLAAAFQADTAAQTASAPAPEPAPAPDTAPSAPAETPAPATPTETTDGKSDRARDEHGRFAPKTETTAPADSKPAEAASAELAVEPQAAKDTTGKPPVAPPRHWADGAKVKWQRLPREVQEELVKADAQGQYGALHAVIEPRRSKIAMKGQTPEQAIDGLFQAWESLESDPAGTLRWLAQQYRVDLSTLIPAAAASASPADRPAGELDYVDPQLQALQARIDEQDRRYEALRNHLSTSQQQAEQQRRTSISGEIQAFRSDPANPHYDIVEQTMSDLIQAKRATGLRDAYDQAVWLHPDLREELISQRMQSDQQRREAEAKTRAEQARKAGGSVTGSPTPGAAVSDMPAPNLRSELERQVYGAGRA